MGLSTRETQRHEVGAIKPTSALFHRKRARIADLPRLARFGLFVVCQQ